MSLVGFQTFFAMAELLLPRAVEDAERNKPGGLLSPRLQIAHADQL
jgi:hypothetical protein